MAQRTNKTIGTEPDRLSFLGVDREAVGQRPGRQAGEILIYSAYDVIELLGRALAVDG